MSDEPEATTPDEIPDSVEAWEDSLASDEGEEPAADADAPSDEAPSAEGDGDAPVPEAEEAGSEEPAVTEPVADAEEVVSGDAPPAEEAALPEGDPPPEEQPTPEPYTLRADGRDIPLDGAMRSFGADGQPYIIIPESSVERQLKHHVADREVWQAELKRLQSERSENEVRADHLVQHFTSLMEADTDGTALWTWLQDFAGNKDNLAKDLQIKVLERERDTATDRTTAADQDAEDRRYQDWAPGALQGAIDGALKLGDFDGLDLSAEELYAELSGLGGDVIFFRATEKEVRERPWGMTFVKGNTYPHYGRILTAINGRAAVVRRLKKQHDEAAAAKAANEAALAGGEDGKPVVAAGDTPVLAGKKAETPTTREEWEASLAED